MLESTTRGHLEVMKFLFEHVVGIRIIVVNKPSDNRRETKVNFSQLPSTHDVEMGEKTFCTSIRLNELNKPNKWDQ